MKTARQIMMEALNKAHEIAMGEHKANEDIDEAAYSRVAKRREEA